MSHQRVKLSPAPHGLASPAGPAKGFPGEAQLASWHGETEGLPRVSAPCRAGRWTPGPALPFAFWRERRKGYVLHVVSINREK